MMRGTRLLQAAQRFSKVEGISGIEALKLASLALKNSSWEGFNPSEAEQYLRGDLFFGEVGTLVRKLVYYEDHRCCSDHSHGYNTYITGLRV